MFQCSLLSCSSSFRIHSGDLLLLVTLLPMRLRCPLTWLERPVFVSNQPEHRGHVCSLWVSGLKAEIKDNIMFYILTISKILQLMIPHFVAEHIICTGNEGISAIQKWH